MPAIVRSVLAVVTGLFLAGTIMVGIESINSSLFPLPAGVDPKDPEQLRAALATMPGQAFIGVLVGWILAALAGGWLAARLAPKSPRGHALAVTAVLLIGAVVNMLKLPHPAWMWVLGVAGLAAAGLLAARIEERRRARAAGGA
jgi:hypothetical protein